MEIRSPISQSERFPSQQATSISPVLDEIKKINEAESGQASVNSDTNFHDQEPNILIKKRVTTSQIMPSNQESPITSSTSIPKRHPDLEIEDLQDEPKFSKMKLDGFVDADKFNRISSRLDQPNRIEVIQEDEETKVHAKPPVIMPAKLKKRFDKALIEIKDHPIEYYESLLYDITRYFSRDLGGKIPKLESIEHYHPLFKLQEKQHEMNELDRAALMESIEELIENHTLAQMDYKLFKMVIEFYSGMLVKWNLIRDYEYSYRHREAVFSSKLIDISEINRELISMEVIYFACIVKRPPLNDVMHRTVKQYSDLVLSSALKLLNFLLLLTDADFIKVHSISGYLAARNPDLALRYKMVPDYAAFPPSYHKLSLKTGCLALCMSTKKEKQNIALREMLVEFEMAYRFFETVLIKDLSHLKSMG